MFSRANPRLVLRPDELDELRRRSRSSHARFYRALVEDLEGRLREEPPEDLWGLEEPDYSDLLEICFSLVVNCGIAYHIEPDERWRLRKRIHMRQMELEQAHKDECEWPPLAPPKAAVGPGSVCVVCKQEFFDI